MGEEWGKMGGRGGAQDKHGVVRRCSLVHHSPFPHRICAPLSHNNAMEHISQGHSEYANFLGFGTFRQFLQLLLPCANMSSPGGGDVYTF